MCATGARDGDAAAAGGLPSGTETEMVNQILFEAAHHDDQEDLADDTGRADDCQKTLDDGVLVEERRRQILAKMVGWQDPNPRPLPPASLALPWLCLCRPF